MANPCKITGMELHVPSRQESFHGDLFELGECWIIRVNPIPRPLDNFKQDGPQKYLLIPDFAPAYCYLVFTANAVDTYIIPKNWAVLSDAARRYINDSEDKYGP